MVEIKPSSSLPVCFPALFECGTVCFFRTYQGHYWELSEHDRALQLWRQDAAEIIW